MLKVVGGIYRGRNLLTPGPLTVPTKTFAKTGIMNALGMKIQGARVLDLFAGSGALGIECLSRGAKEAYFVDSSSEAMKIISRNLENLKIPVKNGFLSDFRSAINGFKEPFDIVILDPPYKERAFYGEAISLLEKRGLLSPGAAIVLEYEGEEPPYGISFSSKRQYKYGRTRATILWR